MCYCGALYPLRTCSLLEKILKIVKYVFIPNLSLKFIFKLDKSLKSLRNSYDQ